MDANIVLITGMRQVGKSTALRSAVTQLRDDGIRVSGLLTERTGPHDLSVTELHTGSRYLLTEPFKDEPGSLTRHFTMNDAALARSGRALVDAFPTQVFALDELGLLELKHGRGWVDALDLLAREHYRLALVVVRPELLGDAVMQMDALCFTVVRVTPTNRQEIPAFLIEQVFTSMERETR